MSEFSRASRKRLLDIFATIGFTGWRVTFVTLTFEESLSFADAKIALRRLLERWRRAYPDAAAIWRMEQQERGAPHFHLLCWNLPFIPQNELQATWEACTGEQRSIVHIALVRSHRGAWHYVSKYVAKASASLVCPSYPHAEENKPGRWWGFHNRSKLPFADAMPALEVPLEVFWRLKRHFRRHVPKLPARAGGFSIYTTNGHQWMRLAASLIRDYNGYVF